MRHYETDSAHAAARIIALALLADGGLDRAELETLARSRLLGRLGLEGNAFDEILRDYCDDLLSSTSYLDGTRLQLEDEVVDALLDDIRDPALQAVLLEAMQQIVSADGIESEREVDVLASALRRWGITPGPAPEAWSTH